jgi:hypothetical protein
MRSDHGSENVDSHFSSCNAMKKEVIYSSGMSVTSHKTARCQKPETYSVVYYYSMSTCILSCNCHFPSTSKSCMTHCQQLHELIFLGSLFYNAFSVTRLYSVNDTATSEWWWWIAEHKHPCLKQDLNPWSQHPSNQGLSLRPHGHCDWRYDESRTVPWKQNQLTYIIRGAGSYVPAHAQTLYYLNRTKFTMWINRTSVLIT